MYRLERETMILFLGDSITHGTHWSRWIDFVPVQNEAVPGFTTDDVANQLQELGELNPAVISLLIGTNDFGDVTVNRLAEDVAARIDALVSTILAQWPDARVLLCSILPRGSEFFERISVTNEIVSKISHERLTFLDCWPVLCDGDKLRSEYLLADGFDVHLNSAGYESWASVLVPALSGICKVSRG